MAGRGAPRNSPGDTHLHKPLPIAALPEHAKRRGLIRYRRYNERSHFVIYGERARSVGARVEARRNALSGGWCGAGRA